MGKQVIELHIKRDQYENGKFYHTANIMIYDTKDVDGTYVRLIALKHIENLEVKHKNIGDFIPIIYVEYNKRRYYFPYIKSAIGEDIYTCIKVEPTNWFRRLIWKIFSINPLWN